jgi:hypothetical protein
MIDLNVKAATKFFFDTKAVMKAADKKTRKVLSKFGAFTRTTARQSIRTAKKTSKAGKPPKSHTGLLKKFIFFVYDKTKNSVVIGPAKLNGTTGDAPRALEYGGACRVTRGSRAHRTIETVHIAARPYMGPAAAKELKVLPRAWGGSA